MSDVTHAEGHRAAAGYLRELLLKPGSYRQAWQAHAVRSRDGVINQLAVAEVLAGRLQSVPSGTGRTRIDPYQLRDAVSDALAGRQFSREILELFVGAFGFAEHEAARLWRLWNGTTRISVISGSHAIPVPAERDVTEVLGPRRHQSLSLHDQVYVGADGRIDRARLMRVIEATGQGVDRIPFLCDTNVLTLEVVQGGKELSGEVRQIGADVYSTEILLARTLALGETITLEYWLTYRYPGNFDDPAEREFRQAVMRQVENLDMRVEFHPDRLPNQVWWAHWDGAEGHVLGREAVTLDSEQSAHRYMRSIEKTVAGFCWEWD